MKIFTSLCGALVFLTIASCNKDNLIPQNGDRLLLNAGMRKPYRIKIDSSYAYQRDSLYRIMAREYALRLLALDQYTGKNGEWREWGGENIYG